MSTPKLAPRALRLVASLLSFSFLILGNDVRAQPADQNKVVGADWEAAYELAAKLAHSHEERRALDVLDRLSPRELPPQWVTEHAHLLHLMGTLCLQLGGFQHALEFLAVPVEVLESSSPSSNQLADALNELGAAHLLLGDFVQAEAALTKSLAIFRRIKPEPKKEIATVHNDLGNLYETFGLFELSEEHHQTALNISKGLDASSDETALSLNNLGVTFQRMGDESRAYEQFSSALAIAVKNPEPWNRLIASIYNNLARIDEHLGRLQRAEERHRQALALRTAELPATDPEIAISQKNLAGVLVKLRRYAEAESLLVASLALRRRSLPLKHPHLSNSLDGLATLYAATGNYIDAATAQQESLQICEENYGSSHPETVEAKARLGTLLAMLARKGVEPARLPPALRDARASSLLFDALASSEKLLRSVSAFISEKGMEGFLAALSESAERTYTLVADDPANSELLQVAMATAILRKGRSVDEAAETSLAALRQLPEADRGAFEALRRLRRQLATLVLGSVANLASGTLKDNIATIVSMIEASEQELAKKSAAVRERRQTLPPNQLVQEIARRLPPDSALVEIVGYTPTRLQAVTGATGQYLAMVLRSDGTLSATPLGDSFSIDAEVERFLYQTVAPPIKGSASAVSDPAPARRLFEKTLQKVWPRIADRKQLFLSLEGKLLFVPFAALRDGDVELIERFQFTYLTSGRDLLRSAELHPSTTVVVFADPAEHAGLEQSAAAVTPGMRLALLATSHGELGKLPPLVDTQREVKTVKAHFPGAAIFTADKATRSAFLALRAPGILHAAVHGVFLPEVGAAINPLFSSGLVLAPSLRESLPASEAPTAAAAIRLLTAFEVAGMDLWGTQIVVLSACDTLRGTAVRGQGVYGLRRAVTVAGAESLLAGMWKVDGPEVAAFMAHFYDSLARGLSRGAAFHYATKSVRARQPHPYFWASLILIGEPGPLRGYPITPATASGVALRVKWLSATAALLLFGLCGLLVSRRKRQIPFSGDTLEKSKKRS